MTASMTLQMVGIELVARESNRSTPAVKLVKVSESIPASAS